MASRFTKSVLAALPIAALAWHFAQPAGAAQSDLDPAFTQTVQPFLKKNCYSCHNVDNMTAEIGRASCRERVCWIV